MAFVVAGLLAVGVGAGAVWLLHPTTPQPPTPAVATAPVANSEPVDPTGPPPAAPSGTRSAGAGCPNGATLASLYQHAGPEPGRAHARTVGKVVCAGGFAAVKMSSPAATETVNTIFALGPPTRFLQAGSGPVCSDNPRDTGAVIVPRSAAATLNCMTAAPDPTTGLGTGSGVGGYTGTWDAHGVEIVFDRSGRGRASYRTYNFCDGYGASLPADPSEPCETPGADLDVGKATVQLETGPSGLVMRTLSSNDHKSWPVGQRQSVRLIRTGVMELTGATASPWGLCKPPASDGICGG